jgi:hypothetical protein
MAKLNETDKQKVLLQLRALVMATVHWSRHNSDTADMNQYRAARRLFRTLFGRYPTKAEVKAMIY